MVRFGDAGWSDKIAFVDADASYLSVAEGFARLADTYDARIAGHPTILLEQTETLASLPRLGGLRVADIGCGTGRYVLKFPELGAEESIGIDLCPQMLALARKKARFDERDVKLARGDLLGGLPLPDQALDVAVCAMTLSFVDELDRAFSALARALTPGGVLVLSERHPHVLRAERAASLEVFRKDNAPYLRFTDFEGRECRIARKPYLTSDYLGAAGAAGLALERIAEPAADLRLVADHPTLRAQMGVPQALVLRFRKSSRA